MLTLTKLSAPSRNMQDEAETVHRRTRCQAVRQAQRVLLNGLEEPGVVAIDPGLRKVCWNGLLWGCGGPAGDAVSWTDWMWVCLVNGLFAVWPVLFRDDLKTADNHARLAWGVLWLLWWFISQLLINRLRPAMLFTAYETHFKRHFFRVRNIVHNHFNLLFWTL